jgi:hypothetical protein
VPALFALINALFIVVWFPCVGSNQGGSKAVCQTYLCGVLCLSCCSGEVRAMTPGVAPECEEVVASFS